MTNRPKSPITTHILDTAAGHPAAGVAIHLDRREADGGWSRLARGRTDADGRLGDLLPAGALTTGTYRLRFAIGDYLLESGREGFYDEVPVVFVVADPAAHYHVPLLLNPWGYSTYRGS